MKRAIFGGSFDPLTLAHYDLAIKLTEHFDEVIVVPAYVSPFKIGEMDLSGEERLELLKRAFAPYPSITVSDCEIKGEGTSYSYITAEKFYHEEDQLYFVIGSDCLFALDKWARPDRLKKTVTFLVVKRPYYPIKQEDLDRARKIFKVEIASFDGKEGSSSLLRVAVAFGKQREVVPETVADYIEQKGLYRDYRYITERYDEFGIKPSRAEHIYRTANSAILLAKLNGANTEKVVRAALLHDIAKYMDEQSLEKYGVEYDEAVTSLPPACRHQITGARLALKAYGETDSDVISAIESHTTGAKKMNIYQKIIFSADYIEEGRSFDGVEKIRALTYENLDDGITAIFENTIKYFALKGEELAPVTIEAYEYHKKEMKK